MLEPQINDVLGDPEICGPKVKHKSGEILYSQGLIDIDNENYRLHRGYRGYVLLMLISTSFCVGHPVLVGQSCVFTIQMWEIFCIFFSQIRRVFSTG